MIDEETVHHHMFRMISCFAYFLNLDVGRSYTFFSIAITAIGIMLSGTPLGDMYSRCLELHNRQLSNILENLNKLQRQGHNRSKSDEEKYVEDLFKWTYNFRLCATSENLAYDTYLAEFQNDENDIRFWSRSTWFMIHYLASLYPNVYDYRKEVAYKAFIVALKYILPCGQCRKHLNDNLAKIPMCKKDGSCRRALFEWSYSLHSTVDKMLGKQSLPEEEMKQYFSVS